MSKGRESGFKSPMHTRFDISEAVLALTDENASSRCDVRWRLASLEWQPDQEGCTNSGRALDFERTTMVLDDLFCDVESQTSSALALFGGEIGIENLAHPRRGNSVASVV